MAATEFQLKAADTRSRKLGESDRTEDWSNIMGKTGTADHGLVGGGRVVLRLRRRDFGILISAACLTSNCPMILASHSSSPFFIVLKNRMICSNSILRRTLRRTFSNDTDTDNITGNPSQIIESHRISTVGKGKQFMKSDKYH